MQLFLLEMEETVEIQWFAFLYPFFRVSPTWLESKTFHLSFWWLWARILRLKKKGPRRETASESRKVTSINCYNPKKYHVNDMQILFWRHFPENLSDSLLFVVPGICNLPFPGPFWLLDVLDQLGAPDWVCKKALERDFSEVVVSNMSYFPLVWGRFTFLPSIFFRWVGNHQLVSQFKYLHSMSVSKTAARACSFPTVASGRSAGCSWPRGVVVASGVKLWLYILAYTLPKWTSNFARAFMPTGWYKPSFYRHRLIIHPF